MSPPRPPYGGRRPFNWPSVVVTLFNYSATVTLFVLLIRSAPGAHFQPSLLGVLHLLCALPLVACTVWLIGMAHGFQARTTVALGFSMGMLADLLFLHGITLLYHRPNAEEFGLVFAALAAAGLIILAVSGNTEGIQRQWRDRLAQEADALTGLLNRRGVTRRYGELPGATEVTAVMLDLNDLKSVNDLGGHSAGDRHLRTVARALNQALPEGAVLGRWGGDEFVLILPGSADLPRLMAAVQAQAPHPDPTLAPFSYGTARVRAEIPLERALALADQQMYESKADTYARRASLHNDSHVSVPDFPHYLLGLNTTADIVRLGLRKAAELAGFEAWFYAQPKGADDTELTLEYQELGGAEGQAVHSTSVHLHGDGLIQTAIQQKRTAWAADYEYSSYAQPTWVVAGVKSVVVTPVKVGDTVPGVVAFTSRHTWHSVTPQARQLLEAVATHLGHQLERQTALAEMRATVEAGITGMGVILEARDLETAGHTARVVALAARLGRAAGLTPEELQALRLGAYLHDLGKLSIPDAVLLKPGPLNDEEWTLMKSHTERGAAMAARLPTLPAAALGVVRSHHERWDGGGYPQGLSGEAIPRLARIFALCDVYDALVSVRPYKRAWTPQEALAELEAQSGRQFDPQLTGLFLQHVAPRAAVAVAEQTVVGSST